MPYGFLDIAATRSVKAAQASNGSVGFWSNFHGERAFDRFTEARRARMAGRDIQHRGPSGFLRAHTPGSTVFRSILIRWTKEAMNDLALLHFACGIIAWRQALPR